MSDQVVSHDRSSSAHRSGDDGNQIEMDTSMPYTKHTEPVDQPEQADEPADDSLTPEQRRANHPYTAKRKTDLEKKQLCQACEETIFAIGNKITATVDYDNADSLCTMYKALQSGARITKLHPFATAQQLGKACEETLAQLRSQVTDASSDIETTRILATYGVLTQVVTDCGVAMPTEKMGSDSRTRSRSRSQPQRLR